MFATFEPVRHARQFWPEWTFHLGALDGGETHVLYPHARAAYMDPSGVSPLLAIAHTVGHLELRHHLTPGETLTPYQCAEAACWASLHVCPKEAAQWPTWVMVA